MRCKCITASMMFCAATCFAAAPATRPGDEVMRPTTRGLRLTPEMARALARIYVEQDLKRELLLDDKQRSQMTDVVARRTMQMVRQNESDAQQVLEYIIETAFSNQFRFTPETGKEFGERCKPLIPMFRGFMKDWAEDAAGILRPEQLQRFRDALRDDEADLDGFSAQLDRWANGGFKPGDRPFRPERSPEKAASEGADDAKARVLRDRRRDTEWDLLQNVGPAGWSRYLIKAGSFFKFDAQQTGKGNELLADASARAGAIMTDEWKAKIRQNRLKRVFVSSLPGQPVSPYLYQLDREYVEAILPIREMGKAFRDSVILLASEEQRKAAIEQVKKTAGTHGMSAEELAALDSVLSGLPRP